jgi:uncharacterized membrane protein YdfJ with MMPL/SSD domain
VRVVVVVVVVAAALALAGVVGQLQDNVDKSKKIYERKSKQSAVPHQMFPP